MANEGLHGTSSERVLCRKIDAIGWGLFFVWFGSALLAGVSWGIGLLGIAIIMLGAQATRKLLGLGMDGFALVVGCLFALGGVWTLLDLRIELVPVLCIVAGLALIVSTLRGGAGGPRATTRRGGREAPAHPPA